MMHLYYTDASEWFVAETPEAASGMAVRWLMARSYTHEDAMECVVDGMNAWPDYEPLAISDEDDMHEAMKSGKGYAPPRKMPAEWALENGPGFWFAGVV